MRFSRRNGFGIANRWVRFLVEQCSIVSTLGGGITAALVGISVIGVIIVLLNVLFNYLLFSVKR